MGRERIADVVVVVFAGTIAVINTVTQLPAMPEPYDVLVLGLLLTGAAALWFRRRAPVAVAWFVALLAAALAVAVWVWPGAVPGVRPEPESILLPSAAPFAAYSVAAFARGHRLAWPPLVVVAATACVGTPLLTHLGATAGPIVALVGGPAALGLYVAARTERAEREQQLCEERARRQERLRLAAEIHDVVSHRVSVMVLQAGALHLTGADEPTRRAAEELRATGCHALDELRELVGLLSASGRSDAADTGPLEPLPDLAAPVAAARSVGIAVEIVTDGEPCLVSPAVGRTAYRVVQEALTNVCKHAPGSRVRLGVRQAPDGVRVSIRNTAPAGAGDAALASAGGGTGLLGLRRRIELVNGTLEAEPCADGGFRVDAALPAFVRAGSESA
ncbi:sensor histidine kinase [Amycolatopsis nigrescens]|uniref:sensor histidine kinase n=1 Tax=Amycolatopsis nigrescens TaxID=381445 RepID=UPI00036C10F6|nr:histidine kinase [Amycolatopsis nigrescens]